VGIIGLLMAMALCRKLKREKVFTGFVLGRSAGVGSVIERSGSGSGSRLGLGMAISL